MNDSNLGDKSDICATFSESNLNSFYDEQQERQHQQSSAWQVKQRTEAKRRSHAVPALGQCSHLKYLGGGGGSGGGMSPKESQSFAARPASIAQAADQLIAQTATPASADVSKAEGSTTAAAAAMAVAVTTPSDLAAFAIADGDGDRNEQTAIMVARNLIGKAMVILISPLIADVSVCTNTSAHVDDASAGNRTPSEFPIRECSIDASKLSTAAHPQQQQQRLHSASVAGQLTITEHRSAVTDGNPPVKSTPAPATATCPSRKWGVEATLLSSPVELAIVTATASSTALATATEAAPPTAETETDSVLAAKATATAAAAAAAINGTAVHVNARPKQKSPTTNENKCASEEPTKVSNESELEANGTLTAIVTSKATATPTATATATAITTTAGSAATPFANIQREVVLATSRVEYDRVQLAERKAKLKSDFFKDSQLLQSPSQTLDTFRGIDVAAEKRSVLELAIPAGNQGSASSLVAQRKLDLKRKFETHLRPKSAPITAQRLPARYSRIEQLVQKFDVSPQSHPHPDAHRRRKMIMDPHKAEEVSAEPHVLALKLTALEQRNSPLSDEGCNLGQSPYSSDDDNISIRTASTMVAERGRRRDKVARSASSDSALGLDDADADADDDAAPPPNQQRRMTLTVADIPLRPALLPLAEPTALPDAPTSDPQQSITIATLPSVVPSKLLLEERVVEIPDPDARGIESLSNSRRESAQSCVSDYQNSECGGVRYVRTPSVVVSDYSDDVMCGITLEEIEYFRAHRLRRRRSSLDTANNEKDAEGHSDVSAASSCSNLYYCGSTISALDGAECLVNGIRTALERKTSDCSMCSASAGEDEDQFIIREQPEEQCTQPTQVRHDIREQDVLAELMAAQHLGAAQPARSRPSKKVGGALLTLPAAKGEPNLK